MRNGLELNGEDLQKFVVPLTSDRKDPSLTPAQRESYVFTQRNHVLYLRYLSGKTLTSIMQVYRENFLRLMNHMIPVEKGATKSLNLHKTLSGLFSRSPVLLFLGPVSTKFPLTFGLIRIRSTRLLILEFAPGRHFTCVHGPYEGGVECFKHSTSGATLNLNLGLKRSDFETRNGESSLIGKGREWHEATT